MSADRPTFLALSPDEARMQVSALGGRAFHADVIRRELLERGTLSYGAMTGLGKTLRSRLEDELPLLASREVDRSVAQDKTTKLLLAFPDGQTVETVHMPHSRGERGATLCVSTQVGCAVGCPFCASGKAGIVRNLEAHEIVEQFLHGRAIGPLSRAVVMGIGEPLLNYENLRAALDLVNRELGLGARKITVSTVGFPDRLRRIAPTRPPFQLAISLHSPDDDERARLVPRMAGTAVEDILAAGDDWFAQTGREVTYEYCLLGGLNDTSGHADRLARRLARRRCSVNLIPYNPIPGDTYARPSSDDATRFRERLESAGIVATVRWSRGVQSDAACGQLRVRRAASPGEAIGTQLSD